jgi:hypothetical protein
MYMEIQESQISKTILRHKNKARGHTFSDLNIYYKAAVFRTMWY